MRPTMDVGVSPCRGHSSAGTSRATALINDAEKAGSSNTEFGLTGAWASDASSDDGAHKT